MLRFIRQAQLGLTAEATELVGGEFPPRSTTQRANVIYKSTRHEKCREYTILRKNIY